MLTYTLEKGKGQSLYASLYVHIREDILSGKLCAGSRLPSKRALAANLGVSIATVESAYAQLIAEGYAVARQRSGLYVCAIGEPMKKTAPADAFSPERREEKPFLDLSGGGGEDVPFPFSVWMKTMRSVMTEKGEALLRPVDFQGAPELRQAIAGHLYQSRGLKVAPEQIVIGAGNEYLYGLLVQLFGRGKRYAVENPGYGKISRVYGAYEVPLCRVELDAEGMRADLLQKSGAQIAHISPAHHYPTGIVMPIARRRALLQWAYGAKDRYIIEDDYDSELRHSGKPVPPMFSMDQEQRVLYLSTFSQTIAPSLRIAYVCLPMELVHRLREKLGFYSCAVPAFEQYTLARFISSGDYERHLNRLKKRFRDKRAEIFSLIAESPLSGKCSIVEENAGAHFLLRLHTAEPDEVLRLRAQEMGLRLHFLSEYEFGKKHGGYLILNYTCLDTRRLPEALEILLRIS